MRGLTRIFPLPLSPFQLSKADKGLMLLSFTLAFCELFNILGFSTFKINNVLMACLMAVSSLIYGLFRGARFNGLYILYFVYLFINVALTNPPAVFQSWLRLGLFVVLLLCVAPVLQNKAMRKFRMQCFKYVMLLGVPLSVISFACYFLGINFIWSDFSHDVTVGGVFSGLFQNSMLLGPVSAVSSCYSFWAYYNTKSKWWIVLFVLCIGVCMFSSSRSAVYGAAVGCMSIMLFANRGTGKRIRQMLVVGIVACATFPLWQGALTGINQKNAANELMGEYGSRTEKFEARIEEFGSSPVFGVGFAAINPHGRDAYNPRTGVVEPGSSWLAVLSMTGVLGFMFMLAIYVNAFFAAKRCASEYGAPFAGLIAYLAFHELFEGYMLAAGSALCFISWLIIGVASDLKYAETD